MSPEKSRPSSSRKNHSSRKHKTGDSNIPVTHAASATVHPSNASSEHVPHGSSHPVNHPGATTSSSIIYPDTQYPSPNPQGAYQRQSVPRLWNQPTAATSTSSNVNTNFNMSDLNKDTPTPMQRWQHETPHEQPFHNIQSIYTPYPPNPYPSLTTSLSASLYHQHPPTRYPSLTGSPSPAASTSNYRQHPPTPYPSLVSSPPASASASIYRQYPQRTSHRQYPTEHFHPLYTQQPQYTQYPHATITYSEADESLTKRPRTLTTWATRHPSNPRRPDFLAVTFSRSLSISFSLALLLFLILSLYRFVH